MPRATSALCNCAVSPDLSLTAFPVLAQVILHVEGLRCAACGMRLKQALLAQVGGVQQCEVEFESGRVVLHGQAIGEDALLGCISELGYSSRLIKFQEEPPGKEESEL